MHPGARQELVMDSPMETGSNKVLALWVMSRCGIRLTGCLPQWWKWAGININAACWHYCIAVNFFFWGGVQRTLNICSLWHNTLLIPCRNWFATLWAKEMQMMNGLFLVATLYRDLILTWGR